MSELHRMEMLADHWRERFTSVETRVETLQDQIRGMR